MGEYATKDLLERDESKKQLKQLQSIAQQPLLGAGDHDFLPHVKKASQTGVLGAQAHGPRLEKSERGDSSEEPGGLWLLLGFLRHWQRGRPASYQEWRTVEPL